MRIVRGDRLIPSVGQNAPQPLTRPTPLPPRANLASLPLEVIIRVLDLLPRRDILALARVCRALAPPSDLYLWRDIDLSIPSPSPADLDDNKKLWAYRLEAKRRVDLINQLSTDRRLGAVISLTIKPCQGSLHASLTLLSFVSPTITSWVLATPAAKDVDTWWWHDGGDFANRFLEYGTETAGLEEEKLTSWSFPSLTTLIIQRDSLIFLGLIPFLCSHAPNLTTLVLSLTTRHVPSETLLNITSSPISDPIERDEQTKIRHMRIEFDYHVPEVEDDMMMDDEGRLPGDKREDYWAALVSLVEYSPELVQLSFRYTVDEQPTLNYMLSHINKLEHLRDLHWREETLLLLDEDAEEEIQATRLESVRRLVMECDSWTWKSFSEVPASLQLESIHLDCSTRTPLDHPAKGIRSTLSKFPALILSPDTQPLSPSFCRSVRKCPRLHTINHFSLPADHSGDNSDIFPIVDEHERYGKVTCQIRSMRHKGSEELLIVRIHLRQVDIVDKSQQGGTQRTTVIHTHTDDPSFDQRSFAKACPPTWQTYSDFGGLTVPSSVIEGMMEVDGVRGEEGWGVRGHEASEAAWKVLMDWKQGLEVSE